ncbi:MAG: hypothetical protein ACI9IT_002643, partial [Glaciecola sp.]
AGLNASWNVCEYISCSLPMLKTSEVDIITIA